MICYLSLGSNLGNRARNLIQAIVSLAADERLRLLRVSPVYETTPVGYTAQGLFFNLALSLDMNITPEELLRTTEAIEVELGRIRSFPNAPRTLDIDLLICGEETRETPTLTLPHPRLVERQFVLVPLADIAPELRINAATVRDLAHRDDSGVCLVGPLRDALWSAV